MDRQQCGGVSIVLVSLHTVVHVQCVTRLAKDKVISRTMESWITCEGEAEFVIPPTPTCVAEVSREWIKYVMDGWFAKNNIRTESVDIISFSAALNNVQVMSFLVN